MQRPAGQDGWKRLVPQGKVFTNDTLVSLPGYPSSIRTRSYVHLQLWGSLEAFTPANPFLLESAVVLHANPDFDLELTLHRGRIYLSNHKDKGPATVRLRFQHELWDLTLAEPGSEVGIDLFSHYTRDIDWQGGEEPRTELYLYVLQGKAGLRDGFHEYPNLEGPTGPALISWDNKGAGTSAPRPVAQPLPFFNRDIPISPQAKEMDLALKEVSMTMVGKKTVDLVLKEDVQDTKPSHRTLSILCLGALDDVPTLLDLLAEEDPTRGVDRRTALFTLRRWIDRGPEYGKRLYDEKTKQGLLIDKKYRSGEAQTILTLLHEFNDVQRRNKETFELMINYLESDRIAIRELAYWHLTLQLAPDIKGLPPYNPAWGPQEREQSVEAWRKLIAEGKLPPPLEGPAGTPTTPPAAPNKPPRPPR